MTFSLKTIFFNQSQDKDIIQYEMKVRINQLILIEKSKSSTLQFILSIFYNSQNCLQLSYQYLMT